MEKRQHRRIPFRRKVYLANQNGDEEMLQASDFSLTGMGILSERPVEIGDKVKLRFKVNTLGKTQELTVSGKIRHVELMDDKYVVGINFLN